LSLAAKAGDIAGAAAIAAAVERFKKERREKSSDMDRVFSP
jgi:hypothetical protein